MVDIAFPRDRAVTFVARRAKSVAMRSSCINPGSVLPSCTCLSALAWWTCRIAMAWKGPSTNSSAPHASPGRKAPGQGAVMSRGRSVDLQPDAHGCPGKHGRQLWVRCGGGDNTRGGQPHRTFILRGREPIPRCCDRHPIYRWRTEWNAVRPVGQTSEITREPDGMFAAWGVRGPWGRARRRGSYSNPQISQSVSRRSSARAREISNCELRHWRQRSCPSSADRKRPQPEGHGRNGILKKTRSSVICSFRICSLSWSAQGNRWWEGLHWTGNKTKMNGFVEISTLLIHSAPKQKSNEWMLDATCRPFIPVCTGSGSGMQNPLANFIGVFS